MVAYVVMKNVIGPTLLNESEFAPSNGRIIGVFDQYTSARRSFQNGDHSLGYSIDVYDTESGQRIKHIEYSPDSGKIALKMTKDVDASSKSLATPSVPYDYSGNKEGLRLRHDVGA